MPNTNRNQPLNDSLETCNQEFRNESKILNHPKDYKYFPLTRNYFKLWFMRPGHLFGFFDILVLPLLIVACLIGDFFLWGEYKIFQAIPEISLTITNYFIKYLTPGMKKASTAKNRMKDES